MELYENIFSRSHCFGLEKRKQLLTYVLCLITKY